MGHSNLTEITVRALKGSERYETTFDTTLPAFGVRCGLKRKTFVVVRGKSRERLTIGHWPDMSVGDARKQAKKLLVADAPEGETKPSPTFAVARERFLKEHYRDRSARTEYQVRRSLERHFKKLEGMQLADIDHDHIADALKKLDDRPSEQLHAYRYLRTFFRWAVRPPRRFIKHSPMEGYAPPSKDRKGSRILSDAELKAIWKASGAAPHAIFRLMMLWGTRNTETTVLERNWAVQGALTIPGAYTKNGRDHAIPIGPLAQSVIDGLPASQIYLFPGRWGDTHIHHGALGKLKREIMKASGTKGWQLRDLRRTFRSNMARLGVPREVCEVLINHAPPVLDEIYDRYDRLPEKREALLKYEHFMVWLLSSRD